MSSYSVAEAKTHLSRLIDEALAGQSVTITRHGKVVAIIAPPKAAPGRITPEWLEKTAAARAARGRVDAVAAVRAMRDGED